MKVHLMFKDRDFDSNKETPKYLETTFSDLGINIVLDAMAKGDSLIYDISKKAFSSILTNPGDITYREEILKDSIAHPDVIKNIYETTLEAIRKKREWSLFGISSLSISSLTSSSVNLLQLFVDFLEKLRKIAEESIDKFESEGFRRFFSMLKEELNDEYLSTVRKTLKDLKFDEGILISAELGHYNQGINYVLRKPKSSMKDKIKWRFTEKVCIHPRDENGGEDLVRREERALNNAANILAQSADHVLDFFYTLRDEIAFYVGAINLHETLKELNSEISFPVPHDLHESVFEFEGLYDISLTLSKKSKLVANSLNLTNKNLIFITGANEGGKSTFLRSVGLAQFMMQVGLFTPAKHFEANTVTGIFTHFIKEEDKKLESGKLDEELARLNSLINIAQPHALFLFNESFSSTNEREGSEIGRQVVKALLENNVKIFFVTHFFDLANSFYEMGNEHFGFLRADRKASGERTFKVIEGKPLATSFGEDLFKKAFVHEK